MGSKKYFEKIMQDYNQNRNGRSLRKYCKDEAIDYDWLIEFKKNYPPKSMQQPVVQDAFIPISIQEEGTGKAFVMGSRLTCIEVSRRRTYRDKEYKFSQWKPLF